MEIMNPLFVNGKEHELRVISSLRELQELQGQEIVVSAWKEITQSSVNLFAEATGDRQWIHVDVERARQESPYGGPIAHGFLTLSLLPELMESSVRFEGVRMGVNYGLNKVRFTAPVPVGSFIRLKGTPIKIIADEKALAGEPGSVATLTWSVEFEIQGKEKPVCIAEPLVRLQF